MPGDRPRRHRLTRSDLEALPANTEALRSIRYLHDSAFDDITDAELTNAARWLRAAAHSCREGAARIDRHLAERQKGPTPPCDAPTQDAPTPEATTTPTDG